MSNVSAQVCESDTYVWRQPLTMNRSRPNADVALCLLPGECSMGKPVANFLVNKRSTMSLKRHKNQAGHRTIDVHTPINNGIVTTRGGTWNVRTLHRDYSLDVLMQEFQRYNLDILGLQETRSTGKGEILRNNFKFLFSCRENGKHLQGVSLLLTRYPSGALLGYDCINERFLTTKLKTKIKNLNVIRYYAPTEDYDENEKDTFYSKLQDILNSVKKGDISLALGDLNTKVGTDSNLWAGVLGPFGIDCSNGNGEHLPQVEFFNSGDKNSSLVYGREEGVIFVKRPDGRSSGDAFVLFDSDEEAEKALRKHREVIGSRYIEVFRSNINELQQVMSQNSEFPVSNASPPPPLLSTLPPISVMPSALLPASRKDCIRLRGLPYEAQVEHVLDFLREHAKNIILQGVHMVYNAQGQPSGEAFIQMNSEQSAFAASQLRHHKYMVFGKKQRYIEVFQCSAEDMNLLLSANLPLHRTLFSSGGSGLAINYGLHLPPPPPVVPVAPRVPAYYTPIFYWPYPSPPVSPANYFTAPVGPATVLMRGLPFSASVADVIAFFQGCSELTPECIRIQHSPDGRPNGEALVSFPSVAEAELAINERHRHTIGTRYIELFAA